MIRHSTSRSIIQSTTNTAENPRKFEERSQSKIWNSRGQVYVASSVSRLRQRSKTRLFSSRDKWSPRLLNNDDSYFWFEWQIDVGISLIKNKLTIRLSYLGREADSYYKNVKNHLQNIFSTIPIAALAVNYIVQY